MLRVDNITKDWKEAGSFPAQINLYGFWDEHCFLMKSGDLGAVLKIGGIDYEALTMLDAITQSSVWRPLSAPSMTGAVSIKFS